MRIAAGPVPVVRVDPRSRASSWLADLPASAPLFVIAVDTPDSTNRTVARLKCLSLGLVEWSLALQSSLGDLQVVDLDLPAGWLGAVAYR